MLGGVPFSMLNVAGITLNTVGFLSCMLGSMHTIPCACASITLARVSSGVTWDAPLRTRASQATIPADVLASCLHYPFHCAARRRVVQLGEVASKRRGGILTKGAGPWQAEGA